MLLAAALSGMRDIRSSGLRGPIAAPVARPVAPVPVPISGAPVSTGAPVFAARPAPVAVVQKRVIGPMFGAPVMVSPQPPINTPPSGAPPSVSLPAPGVMPTDATVSLNTPIAGFSVTTGWIVMLGIVGLVVYLVTRD